MRRGPGEPGLRFEWDPGKARTNLTKHGVSFQEGSTVFDDPFATTVADLSHSDTEERLITAGRSVRGRLLSVGHVERGSRIRLYFARRATKRERQTHEER